MALHKGGPASWEALATEVFRIMSKVPQLLKPASLLPLSYGQALGMPLIAAMRSPAPGCVARKNDANVSGQISSIR